VASHVLNFTAADASQSMTTTSFADATMNQGPVQDYSKLFKAEKDNLEFSEGLYDWVGKDVEKRVLHKFGKVQKMKDS
jgi:hypothetical protein